MDKCFPIIPSDRGDGLHHLADAEGADLVLFMAGNPANIKAVTGLGREDVRVSQPDPANEDIAFHIMDMYRQVGGGQLVRRVMEEKWDRGTTL